MFKRIVPILLLICLLSYQGYGQCHGTYQWPSSTVLGPTEAAPESIIYCNHPGDYSIITGIVAGKTYVVTNINYNTGAAGYITVSSLGHVGTLVGHGVSPFTFTAAVSGNHYLHLFANSLCSTVGGCYTTTIALKVEIPTSACGTTFYDSGGPSGHYSNNENQTTTLYPDTPGEFVTATFTNFHIETGWDFLNVYNGPNATFPAFPGSPFTGTTISPSFTSTHPSGALTFVFTSDGSGNNFSGWAADITCGNSNPCNLMITTSVFPLGADSCNLEYTELKATEASIVSVFLEDFNSASLPPGWTFTNGNTSFASWGIQNSNHAGGSGYEAELNYNGQGSNTWSLQRSSPINITGYTNLHLSFKHFFDHFQEGPMTMYVETATNATGSWTVQHSLINQVLNVYGTENIDIAALDGNTSLYLRFRFSGSTEFLNRWSIDDIHVTADGIGPAAQTIWSPITGLYTDANLSIPYTSQILDIVYAAPNGTQLYNATDQNACNDTATVTHNKKTWNGSVDNNWYKSTNWTPNGTPTSDNCVVIPPTVSTFGRSPVVDVTTPPLPVPHAYAKNVLVKNNGSLVINANSFIEITEGLTVQTNADVLIRDSGSLIQIENVIANNNSGTIRMQRSVPGGVAAQNYVYWSSPVEGFDVGEINTAESELRWQWEPTTAAIYGNWTLANGFMSVGRGYIVRGLETPPAPIPENSVQFSGRPHNGIINVPVTRGNYSGADYPGANPNTMATEFDDNWNLIGNPYPSAIAASAFIEENSTGSNPKIDGTIYLWNHSSLPSGTTTDDPFYGNYVYNYLGSDYVAFNGTGPNPPVFSGNIAAGQSFFVQMLHATVTPNTVNFNNTMRSGTPANDNFLRSTECHRIWLDLIDQNNLASSTLVGYVTNATNEEDRLYDGYNLSDSSLQFYSMIGERGMTIQGRVLPFDENDTVALGFVVPQNDSYKIAINTLDGLFTNVSQNILLEDTYMNTLCDLRTAPYSFTSESGTFNNRFILRYIKETLSTPVQVSSFGFNIIGLKDSIIIRSDSIPIHAIVVYDVLGRVLANYKNVNTLEFKVDLIDKSKGPLIVKATLTNGQQNIKKVIYK